MTEIEFKITNNPWINNGIVRFYLECNKYDFIINDIITPDYIKLELNDSFENCADQILYELATDGTYNYSQVFKLLNMESSNSYPQPSKPAKKGDGKKKEDIFKEDKKIIKKKGITAKSKEQIWKMRLSYLSNEDNYLKIGLNFATEIKGKETYSEIGLNIPKNIDKKIGKYLNDEFRKLKNNTVDRKNVCPICGSFSKEMIDIKQSINPLSNEHHNNEIEGFSKNKRKKLKICPTCFVMSCISLFDKYIPFYNKSNETILILPLINDFVILKKILNNLSTYSQFIDFNNPKTRGYSTNIESLNNTCNSSAVLSLLHNIQNRYSEDETVDLFSEKELMQICDWIMIKKDTYSFYTIHSSNRLYKILESVNIKDSDKYLLTDCLNKISINDYNNAKIESLYNSLLRLDGVRISNNLFELSKYNISKIYAEKEGYSLYLFVEIFLDKIMDEIIMLEDELKDSCKSIAESIGKNFYDNISMMTKFAYATDVKTFKNCVEEASFLMAKKSTLDNKSVYYSIKNLEILLNKINDDNFSEIKTYFVSFMSAYAIQTNYNNNKKKGE